jgi:surface polysaccharide O-acyltransferase-like enzyme
MQLASTGPQADRFQGDIHRLRGVAILLIVATHCVTFFSWTGHLSALDVAHDLFDNSTLIFMFISGYLFHHTSGDFHYGRYLKTKARNVVIPYAIAAAPGIAYVLLYDSERLHALGLDGTPGIEKAAYLLVYGGAQVNYALWFVPVMCLYYLASPLLLRLFNRPSGLSLLLILVPLSVLMHRPSYAHGHNVMLALYFLSAYAIGMLCSKYHDYVVPVLDANLAGLLFVSGAIIVGHLALSSHHGNYSVLSFRSLDHVDNWVDWLFIQKMVLTFALWALIRRLAALRLSILDSLATVSFTVYFLHLYVLFVVAHIAHAAGIEIGVGAFCGLLAIAIVLPAIIATGARRLVPRWSRTLIGS